MLTAQERIDAAQAKRKALADKELDAKIEQLATDLEAICELEAEHGHDRVIRINLSSWVPGMAAPTCLAVRVPLESEKNCSKFIDRIHRAKDGSQEKLRAQDDLARECIVYPPKGSEAYKAALEIAPLVLSHVALQIINASQGQVEEQKKE